MLALCVQEEDEASASQLVGWAMLGLYAAQSLDEAECEASPAATASPVSRAPSATARTPSSRTRGQFNVTNPILIRGAHSSSPSSSSASSSVGSSFPSPVLSPLAMSPSHSGSGSSVASSSTLSSAHMSSSSSPPDPASWTGGAGSDGSDSDDSGSEGRRRSNSSYDPSIHLRAKKRLSRHIDARALSDKLHSHHLGSPSSSFSSSSSSYSSSSSSSSSALGEQRAHHERFLQLVQPDGSLTLTLEELPGVSSWTHLGSFLLQSPRVIALSFRGVPVTEASVEALGRSVLASIRSLVFVDNRIGLHPATLSLVVALLSSCVELQSLAITRNSLTDVDCVWRLLESHRQLRAISLADNGLDTSAALALSNVIRRIAHDHSTQTTPRTHRLRTAAEDDGEPTTLTLDVSYNRIDAQGEAALRAARDELARITQGRVELELIINRLPRSPFFSALALSGVPPLSLPSASAGATSLGWLASRSSRMVSQLMMSRASTGATASMTVIPPVALSLSRFASLPSLATTSRQA